jgi:uridine kinase
VESGDLVVLEGVGSADPAYDDRVSLRVLVTAPRGERLRRGIDRDGEALRPHWERWLAAEEQHLARARTVERADVVVDGTTGGLRVSRDA